MLRLQARSTTTDPRQVLEDSVNRILAIAAVHEVLMERREDDVDLGELIDRLRRMIVQGLGAGKEVAAETEPVSLAGDRATALALVFSELLQNALEHGGQRVGSTSPAATATPCSRSPTTAPAGAPRRTARACRSSTPLSATS
ncbi:MAG: sensor histidine kinase [Thermoleophilia bacterium]